MYNRKDQSLSDVILARAADVVGDVTAEVLSRFYQRFPDAKTLFYEWDQIRTDRLEAEMVSQSLYCLMYHADRPIEIEIILRDTVPYHRLVLDIPPTTFLGLIEATCEVIFDTIPVSAQDEIDFWMDLQAKIHDMVERGAKEDWTYRQPEKLS